jgi:hypothetical protein
MSAKTKPRAKQSGGPIVLKCDAGDDLAIVAWQKAWAYDIAAGIERGSLPAAEYWGMIASMVRRAADQWRAPTGKKVGNPSFKRKLPDDDTVAVLVGCRIGVGDELAGAIDHVAESFEVDRSRVAKIFRKRRAAVADFFVCSNLAHRVGAIRGE